MEGTFSVNKNTITQTTNYPLKDYLSLSGAISTDDIMYPLRDNKEKLVFPEGIRNAVFSLWTSIPFKPVAVGTYSYIGVDTLNPSDNDLEKTIFIGKRSFSGTYSYSNSHDIMTPELLSSTGSDIYLFNTKKDTVSNTITKISILSGTGGYTNAPYIQGSKVSGVSQSLAIDFISKSGDVNFGNIIPNSPEDSPTASLILNGIETPSILENYQTSIDNGIWFWEDGKVVWDELKFPPLNNVGSTGSELNLNGRPVTVNGYSLELNDHRPTPETLGGIVKGTTFDNIAISEVLRAMIYTYLPPQCTIEIDNRYAEVGTYPVPTLSYTIMKRTLPTLTTSLHNMIPGFYDPITDSNQVTKSGTSSGIVISPIAHARTYFTITVNDGKGESNSVQQAKEYIEGIYPYFYGFSNLSVLNNAELYKLTKSVEYKSNKKIDISGSGYYYFIYDASYGPLTSIIDPLSNNYINSFTYTIRKLSHSTWALKDFYVYQMNMSQIGPPSVNYYFNY